MTTALITWMRGATMLVTRMRRRVCRHYLTNPSNKKEWERRWREGMRQRRRRREGRGRLTVDVELATGAEEG
jgi:hypothetical protein